MGNSKCDSCNKKIKPGDMYALMGEYPGFVKRMFFGPSLGLDQFPGSFLLCQKCFKERFQERKKDKK